MAEEGSKKTPDTQEIKERLRGIRDRLRITKITCTRSVKSRNGDSFVAYSAAWQSVQDDQGGPGGDVGATAEDEAVYASQGMKLQDAKLARYMLAVETDIAALESAAANGGMTPQKFQDSVSGVKENYNRLVLREMGVRPNGNSGD